MRIYHISGSGPDHYSGLGREFWKTVTQTDSRTRHDCHRYLMRWPAGGVQVFLEGNFSSAWGAEIRWNSWAPWTVTVRAQCVGAMLTLHAVETVLDNVINVGGCNATSVRANWRGCVGISHEWACWEVRAVSTIWAGVIISACCSRRSETSIWIMVKNLERLY